MGRIWTDAEGQTKSKSVHTQLGYVALPNRTKPHRTGIVVLNCNVSTNERRDGSCVR